MNEYGKCCSGQKVIRSFLSFLCVRVYPDFFSDLSKEKVGNKFRLESFFLKENQFLNFYTNLLLNFKSKDF